MSLADYPTVESKQPGFKIRVTFQGCGTNECATGLQGSTLYPLDIGKLLGLSYEEIVACIDEEKACLYKKSEKTKENKKAGSVKKEPIVLKTN